MTPSPSKSTVSARTVRSHARLSFKELVASKGKGKASSSPPLAAPKASDKAKRKSVEIIDVEERPTKKASIAEATSLAIFIPDDIETASLAENLEGALSSHWLTYQQLRSGQGKLTRLLQDAQKAIEAAQSKLNEVMQRMKDAEDKAMIAEDREKTLEGELKSQEEKASNLEIELAKLRVEIMEEYEAGKHSEWDLTTARAELEKEFPQGCPHLEYLREAGLDGDAEAEESSGRTAPLREDNQEVVAQSVEETNT